MTTKQHKELTYLKSLDGIRGIAVLLVIMIHSHLCSFGWVGVQMFFVLSGFLITRILVSDSCQNLKGYLLRFYWRRGLRIWPVYFGFLTVCIIAYFLIKIPESTPTAWPWLVTFTYNFGRFLPGFADSNYYGHFWTLCVEEQFYLVWPFAVFFLSPIALRRVVIAMVVAGPVVRFVSGFCLGAWLETPAQIAKAVHSLPTSHLDAFAFGALLTMLPTKLGEWLKWRAMKVFFAMLAVTVIAGLTHAFILKTNGLEPAWLALGYGGMADYFQYTWTYTLLNATSAALIFCALQPTILQRWLTWPWLLHIGKISYGLYVFHLPLMHISHSIWPASYHSPQGLTRFASYFLVALALSTLSYRIFEKRFLGLKDSFWGRRMAVATKPPV
jgi:hypothetical protein